MKTPRIVLADEQSMFCDMVARLLEPDFEVISKVHDGESLLGSASLRPDAVILDLRLPGVGALDLVRRLRKASPRTKLIVLTMADDEALAANVLEAGASAYVLKTGGLEELPAALGHVLRGETYVTPVIAAKLAGGGKKTKSQLTAREQEVLALLVDGKPMREVARLLDLTPRTIAFHKYRIMKKLGVSSSAELIRAAIKRELA
jgi:DNA-binding NarL/FixJ family response regulator